MTLPHILSISTIPQASNPSPSTLLPFALLSPNPHSVLTPISLATFLLSFPRLTSIILSIPVFLRSPCIGVSNHGVHHRFGSHPLRELLKPQKSGSWRTRTRIFYAVFTRRAQRPSGSDALPCRTKDLFKSRHLTAHADEYNTPRRLTFARHVVRRHLPPLSHNRIISALMTTRFSLFLLTRSSCAPSKSRRCVWALARRRTRL